MKYLFCSMKKVWLQEEGFFGFFFSLFLSSFSVGSFKWEKNIKYQMSWKIPCFGQQKHAVYEVCVSQGSAKSSPSWYSRDGNMMLACLFSPPGRSRPSMPHYGSPAIVLISH